MSEVTLEAVQAKQAELAAMIEKLTNKPMLATVLVIAEAEIALRHGEHYAGAVLDSDGTHLHHLILMAERPDGDLNWQDAMDWAAKVGGSLPTRQEQALLFANCKPHLDASWHWSCQTNENDASYAWYCDFGSGSQYGYHESYEGSCRAVRRV